jgi:hypothetical protein
MPVQINEIVIRALVEGGEAQRPAAGQQAEQGREEIVTECVEQVLEILKNQQER